MISTAFASAPLASHHQTVHEQALAAAQSFRKAESALIDALIAVERDYVFAKLGFSSLFTYAVEALRLSEAVASSAITVARKARAIPALQQSISAGVISISKAKKIASVITPENQTEWLEKAESLSSRKLEKEVAGENPKTNTPERAKYVSKKRLYISLGVEEELMLRVRQTQHLVSQSRGHAASLEETLEDLVTLYLKYKDPLEKAKRVIAKKGIQKPSNSVEKQFPGTAQDETAAKNSEATNAETNSTPKGSIRKPNRTPIPEPIQHQVRLRDQSRCQFPRHNGTICGEKRWLDIHHVIPVFQGGSHDLENLITLCKAHHSETHRNIN